MSEGVPYATALAGDTQYIVERRVLAGVPCLIERPFSEARGAVVVHHGVTAMKEGNAGVFSALTGAGLAVVLPDAPLHGERALPGLAGEALGARNFVWLCAALGFREAPGLLASVREAFGGRLGVMGISMGGYVAHAVAQAHLADATCVISSGGRWEEPEVTVPAARAFLDAHRPARRAGKAAPLPLALLHGDADPAFPLADFEVGAGAYRSAYAADPERLRVQTFAGVAHYTSPAMRDAALDVLLEWL